MNSARKGNAAECRVAAELEAEGWVVGLRRNRVGGGDLLAVKGIEVWLIEVKSTRRGPYASFLPADRAALLEVAEQAGGTAWLAWAPSPTKPVQWILSDEWP